MSDPLTLDVMAGKSLSRAVALMCKSGDIPRVVIHFATLSDAQDAHQALTDLSRLADATAGATPEGSVAQLLSHALDDADLAGQVKARGQSSSPAIARAEASRAKLEQLFAAGRLVPGAAPAGGGKLDWHPPTEDDKLKMAVFGHGGLITWAEGAWHSLMLAEGETRIRPLQWVPTEVAAVPGLAEARDRARLAATPSPARSDRATESSGETISLPLNAHDLGHAAMAAFNLAYTSHNEHHGFYESFAVGWKAMLASLASCATSLSPPTFSPARSDRAGAEGQVNVASLFRAALDAARDEGMYVGDDHNCGDDWDAQVEEAKHSAEDAERAAFAALDAALAAAPTPPAGEGVDLRADDDPDITIAQRAARVVAWIDGETEVLNTTDVLALRPAVVWMADETLTEKPAPAAGTDEALRVAAQIVLGDKRAEPPDQGPMILVHTKSLDRLRTALSASGEEG